MGKRIERIGRWLKSPEGEVFKLGFSLLFALAVACFFWTDYPDQITEIVGNWLIDELAMKAAVIIIPALVILSLLYRSAVHFTRAVAGFRRGYEERIAELEALLAQQPQGQVSAVAAHHPPATSAESNAESTHPLSIDWGTQKVGGVLFIRVINSSAKPVQYDLETANLLCWDENQWVEDSGTKRTVLARGKTAEPRKFVGEQHEFALVKEESGKFKILSLAGFQQVSRGVAGIWRIDLRLTAREEKTFWKLCFSFDPDRRPTLLAETDPAKGDSASPS